MISYQLAKELKEAAFLQEGHGVWVEEGGVPFEEEPRGAKHLVYAYAPTLSELIEACGNDFEALIKQAGGWGAVSSREHYRPGSGAVTGLTSEEAVARLWLALHAKVNE